MSIGFPKAGGSAKVARGLKRLARKTKEDAIMRRVRVRDKYCRFPLCGCGKFKLRLDVAHSEHRGMGGNPSLDCTKTESMVLVCAARHRENQIALDRGTARWKPLSDLGADGCIAWEIEVTIGGQTSWMEVARETRPHEFGWLTDVQRETLSILREMTL